jgi:hypothetical protein
MSGGYESETEYVNPPPGGWPAPEPYVEAITDEPIDIGGYESETEYVNPPPGGWPAPEPYVEAITDEPIDIGGYESLPETEDPVELGQTILQNLQRGLAEGEVMEEEHALMQARRKRQPDADHIEGFTRQEKAARFAAALVRIQASNLEAATGAQRNEDPVEFSRRMLQNLREGLARGQQMDDELELLKAQHARERAEAEARLQAAASTQPPAPVVQPPVLPVTQPVLQAEGMDIDDEPADTTPTPVVQQPAQPVVQPTQPPPPAPRLTFRQRQAQDPQEIARRQAQATAATNQAEGQQRLAQQFSDDRASLPFSVGWSAGKHLRSGRDYNHAFASYMRGYDLETWAKDIFVNGSLDDLTFKTPQYSTETFLYKATYNVPETRFSLVVYVNADSISLVHAGPGANY